MYNLLKTAIANTDRLFKNFFVSAGSFFLLLESYEVLSNTDVLLSFELFIILSVVSTLLVFIIDGIFYTGFFINRVELFQKTFGTKLVIEFGDLLAKDGWKVIGVNDFFDSKVDEKIISSGTLHGKVLQTFWHEDSESWDLEITNALKDTVHIIEDRKVGNKKRYPIGTSVGMESKLEKFIFVSLAQTSLINSTTNSSAENIICATRGSLKVARELCANKPLILPLLGSGLARIGLSNGVLLDLLICGIFEEIKLGKVTDVIKIVIHPDKRHEFDLKDLKKKWK